MKFKVLYAKYCRFIDKYFIHFMILFIIYVAYSSIHDYGLEKFLSGFGIKYTPISIPFAVISFIVLMYIAFFKFISQRPNLFKNKFEYYRDIPGKYSPAEISLLLYKNLSVRDVFATLLDLVRRNYLAVEQESVSFVTFFKNFTKSNFKIYFINNPDSNDKLKNHEVYLIKWLFNEFGHNNTLDISDMQKRILNSKTGSADFAKSFSEWKWYVIKEMLKNKLMKFQLIEVKSLARGLSIIVICMLISTLLAYMFVFNIIPVIALGLIYSSPHLTALGKDQYVKWAAFSRYLKDYSLLKDVPAYSLVIWEQYLVYAVTFNIADEAIDTFNVVTSENIDNDPLSIF